MNIPVVSGEPILANCAPGARVKGPFAPDKPSAQKWRPPSKLRAAALYSHLGGPYTSVTFLKDFANQPRLHDQSVKAPNQPTKAKLLANVD